MGHTACLPAIDYFEGHSRASHFRQKPRPLCNVLEEYKFHQEKHSFTYWQEFKICRILGNQSECKKRMYKRWCRYH